MSQNKKLILDAKDRPSTGKWIALSFQHVFAMFSATVLVPMLTGLPISVALFASGVGTLIYILCTHAKVPIYLGSSFAYISYIQAATSSLGKSQLVEKIVTTNCSWTNNYGYRPWTCNKCCTTSRLLFQWSSI